MRGAVIDASVVAAGLLAEEHADRAMKILARGELQAPDLIVPEFSSALWKRVVRGEFALEEAVGLLDSFSRIPLRTVPSIDLARVALEAAVRTGRTVYDSMYVSLAIRSGAAMVTADKRLVNALAGGPYARRVIWLGEM
jgi:predicted nucleic acid-binding protein